MRRRVIGPPLHVGIGRRKVASHLAQHAKGTPHFDASLAYATARRRCEHSMRKAEAMAGKKFLAAFERERARIGDMDVGVVEIAGRIIGGWLCRSGKRCRVASLCQLSPGGTTRLTSSRPGR